MHSDPDMIAGLPAAVRPRRALSPNTKHLRLLSLEDTAPSCDAGSILIERGTYRIRLVENHLQHEKVSLLVKQRYSQRGYLANCETKCQNATNRVTLEASSNHHVFGTVTVGYDDGSGLAADDLYQDEIEAFRVPGRRVCEFTKLAIDARSGSRQLLAYLCNMAVTFGHDVFGADHAFIEVNPRHVNFWKVMMGFRIAGPERICRRVNAPAVLMHLDFHHSTRQINRLGGKPDSAERSLYSHFLSSAEQQRLVNRISHCRTCRASATRYPHSCTFQQAAA